MKHMVKILGSEVEHIAFEASDPTDEKIREWGFDFAEDIDSVPDNAILIGDGVYNWVD